MTKPLLWPAWLLLLPLSIHAEWGTRDLYFFDEEKATWKEIEARLPAYPKQDDAISFVVSSASSNEFFIDPKSISVGKDNIVRYTLIVKSTSGATNISFEGIRCDTTEKKLYAFGRDGVWSENKYAKWSRIEYKDYNRQHFILFNDFFCPGGVSVRDAQDAVYGLRQGMHPLAQRR